MNTPYRGHRRSDPPQVQHLRRKSRQVWVTSPRVREGVWLAHCRSGYLKTFQGYSGYLKTFQGYSGYLKTFQGYSGYLKTFQGYSGYLKT